MTNSKIKVGISIIKNKDKENISYSISKFNDGTIKSYNFTGSIDTVENYVSADGIDMSQKLADSKLGCTIIINNENLAKSIINDALFIFTEREAEGNGNPAIGLVVEARTVKLPGNILVSGVSAANIDANAELEDTSEYILAKLNNAAKTNKGKNRDEMKAVRASCSVGSSGGTPPTPLRANGSNVVKGIGGLIKQYF